MSLNHLATRFTCTWPWTTLVLLCDGRIVCGCADPYAQRVLGDCRTHTLSDIWQDLTIQSLRDDLRGGGSTFCGDCPLKLPLGLVAPLQETAGDPGALPTRLYVECTAACNLSCLDACCAPETGITRTREAGMLDVDLFTRVIDEAASSLVRVDFFNYGEAFLHKRAVEMCEYVKTRYPHIYLYTSTNGLAFDEDRARALVRSGIDEVTFSIDGAIAKNYRIYRQRGDLDRALRNLEAMTDEKRRAGLDVPFINWRYILFRWNDSETEMDLARSKAVEIGVDRLTWEITDHPENAFSMRFVEGSRELDRIHHEVWDTSNLGNAIPGATPRARIAVRTGATPAPLVPLRSRAGETLRLVPEVSNLSTRPFAARASYGRRLVRLGAQLCASDGTVTNRDHARAWLPATLEPGATIDVPIDIPTPDHAGHYAVKFDLVSEGIDWFQACGSETTTVPLVVW
jgi:hypothetical protein